MRVQLEVDVSNPLTGDTRHITSKISALRFRKSAPGGFGQSSCSLHHPLDVDDPVIAAFSRLRITDGRHGGVIHEGILVDPAQSASDAGQVYELSADGPSSLATAREEPVLYIDSRLDPWRRSAADTTRESLTTTPGTYTDNRPTLDIIGQRNAVYGTGAVASWQHEMFADAGQSIARVSFSWIAGQATTNWEAKLRVRDSITGGSTTDAYAADFQATGVGVTKVVTTDWPAGRKVATLTMRSKNAVTIADDITFVQFLSIIVRALLLDATGTAITAAASYTTNTERVSAIVTDIVGRFLPEVDGTNAIIATGTYDINSLVYPDPVTASRIFDDLMSFEPTQWWGIFEANAAGKYRFAWSEYDLTTRYVIPPDGGFSSSSSSVDLYNRAVVRYVDQTGNRRTAIRTAASPILDAAGVTRSKTFDAGDNIHSVADANRIGDQFIIAHTYPGNAGSLTVPQRVMDLHQGGYVMPWEIEPGYVVEVPGISPNPDSLNTAGADGTTRFLCAAMEYDISSSSATLDLDNNAIEASLQIAAARRDYRNRRRR